MIYPRKFLRQIPLPLGFSFFIIASSKTKEFIKRKVFQEKNQQNLFHFLFGVMIISFFCFSFFSLDSTWRLLSHKILIN